jgi:GT2 family glycosyltransferase
VSNGPAPAVCVIIVNWNGARFLPRCLQSLHEQTLPNVQILLADNGSTDDSVLLTRRAFPGVEVVEFGRNLGYAQANNKAAALARAPYLLFLNNDTYLEATALSALVSAAEAQPGIAIFAPEQRPLDGTWPSHAGLGLDVLGYPCRGRTFYADGAALFIRRAVFAALGGFDPYYFMFFEEADLCWRAWLWGYRVGAVPEAIVFHKAGGTAGSSVAGGGPYVTSKSKRRLAHRNQLATVLKNYSTPALSMVLPFLAIVTAAEVLLLALTGQSAAIRESYLPAWRDLLRARGYIRTMRRRVQTSRVVSDLAILRRMEWKLGTVSVFVQSGTPRIT